MSDVLAPARAEKPRAPRAAVKRPALPSPLERMRQRQRDARTPPPPRPTFPQKPPRLEQLRGRYLAGRCVTLADVVEAAGLSPQERHVLGERLVGRCCSDIASDEALNVSRQRVQQLEVLALAKLGLLRSIDTCVHAYERAGRAEAMREKAGRACLALLHHPAPGWRPLPQDPAEVEHEARVRRFLRDQASRN